MDGPVFDTFAAELVMARSLDVFGVCAQVFVADRTGDVVFALFARVISVAPLCAIMVHRLQDMRLAKIAPTCCLYRAVAIQAFEFFDDALVLDEMSFV